MGKEVFLAELERLLGDAPEEERREALAYYRDYFEEAGEEREREILESLDSPEKVAAEILGGLSGDKDAGEFTETGFRDGRFEEPGDMPDKYAGLTCSGGSRDNSQGVEEAQDGNWADGWKQEAEATRNTAQDSKWGQKSEDAWDAWSSAQDSEWGQKSEDAWNTARDSEWGRRAEDAWNTARDSEWGRKAEDAWNTARDSEWGRKAEDAWNAVWDRSRRQSAGGGERHYGEEAGDSRGGKPVKRGGNRNWVLVILLLVFFGIPLAGRIISWVFSFAGGLLGVVFSILGGIIGAVAGILGGLIGLIGAGIGGIFTAGAAGVGLIATGIQNMAAPVVGVMLVGLGFLCFAAVFLLLILVRWGIATAVPGVFRLTAQVIRCAVGAIIGGIKKMTERRKRDETID